MTERHLVGANVIEYDGVKMLVVQWNANPTLGLRKPAQVILLSSIDHQWVDDPKSPYRVFVPGPLPIALLDGMASHEMREEFGVVAGPDITLEYSPNPH